MRRLKYLFIAPLMGLAFVVFLPFAGFGVLLWAIVEKCRSRLKASPPIASEDSC